ncbi:hypothetical protein MTP99_010226 [Tenebrio molitor]|nr:hypothetical protein MTP99_010226 [Tenebrio molitor]
MTRLDLQSPDQWVNNLVSVGQFHPCTPISNLPLDQVGNAFSPNPASCSACHLPNNKLSANGVCDDIDVIRRLFCNNCSVKPTRRTKR